MIFIGSLSLFALIGIVGIYKKTSQPVKVAQLPVPAKEVVVNPVTIRKEESKQAREKALVQESKSQKTNPVTIKDDFPDIDRIFQLFTTGPAKLPIVETISYSINVPWLKGRPAWLTDYANYYGTSRHFIARGLNGKPDYFTQKINPGSRFNVFRKDKNIQFYLLVDISRCKMGFYYVDLDTQERLFLKTYQVGLGKLTDNTPSGTLTPLGKYLLGSKVAVYKPGMMGQFQNQKIEMIQIFGTRWMPFEKEIESNTAPAKGYGIHGAPWVSDTSGNLQEYTEVIGRYDSDGCIRLSQKDVEELFSIIISKPTIVEVVKDFREAKLPGTEVASPTR